MARRTRAGGITSWGRRLMMLAALLIAIPLILTPIYAFVPPVSVPMLERYVTGRPVVREWRSMSQISDRLKAAVILSEDGMFCSHWGVDFAALQVEIDDALSGKGARGASTITMQVARNLFLWNGQSYVRKALEIPLALYVDLVLPKARIMEIYLNIAEWGPNGQFGVGAGAEAAFGVEPQNLPWQRASLLTTALPNPRLRLPAKPSAGTARIAAIIERRAIQYGQRAACVSPSGTLAF